MDVRTFRGANIDSDHYLLISIISQISNARKTYGTCARKLNSEKLKSPEISSAYREKLNGYLIGCADNNNDDMRCGFFLKMPLRRQLALY